MTAGLTMSVVIPTHDRREEVLSCLAALEAQTYPHDALEVIVVSDGSTDGTKEGVESFAARSSIRMRCLVQPRGGPGAARNSGAVESAGAVIAFTEDDVVPEADWLEKAARYFEDPSTIVVEGRTQSPDSRSVRSFEAAGQHGFLPCNLFVRREAFNASGGFDARYSDLSLNLYFREDSDFGFRMAERGYKAVFADDVVVTHPPQFGRPLQVLRHAKRYMFDPLLYKSHPALFRKEIEAKRLGPLVIHRPFHYFSLFFVAGFIIILVELFSGRTGYLPGTAVIMLLLHFGIRYRYEQRAVPTLWNIPRTLVFAILPFYYLAWFVRGCIRFKSWGALL